MTLAPFLAAAREEFLVAAERYEAELPGLGEEFIRDVERALERIATFPEHGSPHLAGTRRTVLRRFPFDVVYVVEPEGVLVVAIAHQRRFPGYWCGRLVSNR